MNPSPEEFLKKLLSHSLPALRRIKGLEKTLLEYFARISDRQLQIQLNQLCQGFEGLSGEEKRARLKEMLKLLKGEEGKRKFREERKTDLKSPVRYLKGIGPWLSEKLEKKGIHTIEDLLYYLPYRYEDRRNYKKISSLKIGERAVVAGKVVSVGRARGRSWQGFQAVIDDGSGTLLLRWFHSPGNYLEERLEKGRVVIACQVVRKYGAILEMAHPEMEILEPGEELDSLSFSRIVPVYSLPEGFSQKQFRSLIHRALEEFSDQLADIVPAEIRAVRKLPDLKESLKSLHFPGEEADISSLNQKRSVWHCRLYYQEFFLLELALALSRRGISGERAYPVRGGERLSRKLRQVLGFTLTPAQERVIKEIEQDLARSKPMHRLLQGDVGAGKTIVALFSALRVISAGLQVAVMAPSEVLAEQHWLNFHRWLDSLGISCALLTSGVRGKRREEILEQVRSGRLKLLVGTQSLIQQKVEFEKLGLAIIDEQHRFGVKQRAQLKAKGKERIPHILVMTATPIPRSLAMTAYGDLDLSLLDQLPPGRKPPRTHLIFAREISRAWREVKARVEAGEQAYIVYPLVEESARLELANATEKFKELSERVFAEFSLGLLHGRMPPEKKEQVMERFRAGEIQILVATTVIEVGIDVPNATVMVIEHCERFGLSQLHQLRGRVARSEKEAVCYLVAHPPFSESAKERLRVVAETQDGFKIAEADLRLRGPGEFLGTRQSGMPPLKFADLIRDVKELSLARNDAFAWAEKADWQRAELVPLKKELKKRYGKVLSLARVG